MISLRRGMASKALLMSIVVSSVRCGFLELMPLEACCVRLVKRVFVECSALKPSCVGERGTCCVILFRICHSNILDAVQSSVIGLYVLGSCLVLV